MSVQNPLETAKNSSSKKKKKKVISVPVVFCFTAQGWAQLCLIFITEKKNHIKRTVKLNFCPANCFIPFSKLSLGSFPVCRVKADVSSKLFHSFLWDCFLCVKLRLIFLQVAPGCVGNGWVWVWSNIQSRRTWRQHECPRGKSGEPAATSEPSPNPRELGLQTCQWTPSTLYPEQPKLVSPSRAP